MIKKIVSGGQTGADRGGLNAGMALGIPIGGWAPKNFEAEDGRVPDLYGLKECPIGGYIARTEQNVLDSDITVIFYYETMSGGTLLTKQSALLHKKPYIAINCLKDFDYNVDRLVKFFTKHPNSIVNVAGPRSSKGENWNRSIGSDTQHLLMAAIRQL